MKLISKHAYFHSAGIIITLITPLPAYSAEAEQIAQTIDEQLITKKLQQCMQLVDQTVINVFQSRGKKLDREIEILCRSDKRNKAQNEAIDFGVELARSTDLANYRKCRKLMPGKTSELQKMMKRYFISDLRFRHACDYIKP